MAKPSERDPHVKTLKRAVERLTGVNLATPTPEQENLRNEVEGLTMTGGPSGAVLNQIARLLDAIGKLKI